MKKRLLAFALSVAMVLSLSAVVWADEAKEDEVSTETAETAPDAEGTLSFENLGARMKAGSYTLLALGENIAAIESIDYKKMEDELRDNLNNIANQQWNISQMASVSSDPISVSMSSAAVKQDLQQAYDSCREVFDDLRDGKLQEDNANLVWQLENAQNTVIMMGQSMYITLLGLEDSDAALGRQSAALDRTITEMELRYNLGQISAMTLEQVKSGKVQLDSGRATLQMNIAALRRQLNAMVGAELTETFALQALPEVTDEQLAEMNVEQDLEKAKKASYSLFAEKQKLDDADETYKDAKEDYGTTNYKYKQATHTWQAAQYTYNAAVEKYELSFRALYDTVKNNRQVLDAARVALECKRSDLASAQLRYEQGAISENALHEAEDALYAAQDTVSTAEYDLFTAYNNYRWATEYGLLNE